jgi:hypothetical protein
MNSDKEPNVKPSPEEYKQKMTQIVFNINTQINVNCLHKNSDSSDLNIYNSQNQMKKPEPGLYLG